MATVSRTSSPSAGRRSTAGFTGTRGNRWFSREAQTSAVRFRARLRVAAKRIVYDGESLGLSPMHALALSTLLLIPAAEPGTVSFHSDDAKFAVPERYRLAPHTFPVEVEPSLDLPYSGVTVSRVRFPSAVATPHAANNTVHAEYFRPAAAG